ncbi:hypothetical protein JL_7 [Bacillus phage JL]|uniref:Uncharacterized protein n=1 Tax=Bacillus phage JL TaxID=1296655 RepID=S5MMF7_9CAUD|nr:hypothetical protein AVV47_gp007 [Bacillus phage JL]AGR46890.1 hypothetical protein JL_7 [Bacillus phage JL]
MTKVLVNNTLIPAEVMEELALRLTIQEAEWHNIEGDMYLAPASISNEHATTMWAHADHMNEIPALDDLSLTLEQGIITHGIMVSVYKERYIDVTFYHVLVVNG